MPEKNPIICNDISGSPVKTVGFPGTAKSASELTAPPVASFESSRFLIHGVLIAVFEDPSELFLRIGLSLKISG